MQYVRRKLRTANSMSQGATFWEILLQTERTG